MKSLAWCLSIAAFLWCISLSSRLKRVERILKEPEVRREEASLGQILSKNIGSCVKLELEDDCDCNFDNTPCRILDTDEKWVLVRQEKKGFEGLIRIRQIKGLEFVEE